MHRYTAENLGLIRNRETGGVRDDVVGTSIQDRFGMMYEVTPVGGQGRIKVNQSKGTIID
jgi:hypothetical protein